MLLLEKFNAEKNLQSFIKRILFILLVIGLHPLMYPKLTAQNNRKKLKEHK